MVLVTFSWPSGSSVSSVVLPGSTSGSLSSGVLPVAVATLTTSPFRMSASVTTYSAVYTLLVSPGARLVISHLSPVSSSVTTMPLMVTLPSFFTVIS